MPNRIIPRRSFTPNSVPLPATDISAAGELLINWADKVAYTKDANGNLVTVTLGGSGGGGVTEIVEAATEAAFPATGAAGKLYIATDVSRAYRWVGTAYVEVGVDGGGSSNWTKVAVPASATATGSEGQYAYGGGYFYLATGTNQWERAALSTWVTPLQFSGLAAWYDASDAATLFDSVSGGLAASGGGLVKRWEDKSGNGRHLTEATNAPSRLLSQRNSRDVVAFDGANDILKTAASWPLTGDTAFSVFVVYKKQTATKGSVYGWGTIYGDTGAVTGLYDDGSGAQIAYNGAPFFVTTPSNDTWNLLTVVRTAGAINTSHTVRRNGVSAAGAGSNSSATPNLAVNKPFVLGRWADYDFPEANAGIFHGQIGEVVVYGSALATASGGDMQQIENYLMTKWGIA